MSPSKAKNVETDVSQQTPASFEQAVVELESLVNTMDSQNLGLDQLLKDYKRGAFLVKYCRDRLNQVRKEVTEIEHTLKPAEEGDQ